MFAKIVKCPAVNIASILSSFWYIYTRQWSCNTRDLCGQNYHSWHIIKVVHLVHLGHWWQTVDICTSQLEFLFVYCCETKSNRIVFQQFSYMLAFNIWKLFSLYSLICIWKLYWNPKIFLLCWPMNLKSFATWDHASSGVYALVSHCRGLDSVVGQSISFMVGEMAISRLFSRYFCFKQPVSISPMLHTQISLLLGCAIGSISQHIITASVLS